ncbi:DUF6230 family protein, partial [Pseudonocardia sp.]|uniref:DUF6230 family protein n=1 Tax=Pseudonocardia sp. TaxID=60912 RepID=UPI0026211E56
MMEHDIAHWSDVVRHRRSPEGRTLWRRFLVVLVPAVLVLILLATGVASGAVPVALALEGQQSLKITAQQLHAEATGTFPSFVQNKDGSRQPVIVVGLNELSLGGLCASTAVSTPVGKYVLRITTAPGSAPVQAGAVQFALESIDGLGAFGQQLSINHDLTAPDGTPIDTSTGGVPLTVGGLGLDVSATARWATVNQLKLSGLGLKVGQDQKECF